MGRPSLPATARNRYRSINDLIFQLESFEDECDKRTRPMSANYDAHQPTSSAPNVLYWSMVIAEEVRRESLLPTAEEMDLYGVERVDEVPAGPRFRIPLAHRNLDSTSIISVANQLEKHAMNQDYPNNSASLIMARSGLAPQPPESASLEAPVNQAGPQTSQVSVTTNALSTHSLGSTDPVTDLSSREVSSSSTPPVTEIASTIVPPNARTATETPGRSLSDETHTSSTNNSRSDNAEVEVARRDEIMSRNDSAIPQFADGLCLGIPEHSGASVCDGSTHLLTTATNGLGLEDTSGTEPGFDVGPLELNIEDDVDMGNFQRSPPRQAATNHGLQDTTGDEGTDEIMNQPSGLENEEVEADHSDETEQDDDADFRTGNDSHITAYPSGSNKRARTETLHHVGSSSHASDPVLAHRTGVDRCSFCASRDNTVCSTTRPLVGSKPLACDPCHKRRTKCSLAVDLNRLKVGRGMATEAQFKLLNANEIYSKRGDDAGVQRVRGLIDKLQILIDLNPGM